MSNLAYPGAGSNLAHPSQPNSDSSTPTYEEFNVTTATKTDNELTNVDISGAGNSFDIDFEGGDDHNRAFNQCGRLEISVTSAENLSTVHGYLRVTNLPTNAWCGLAFVSPSGPGTFAAGAGVVDNNGTRQRKNWTGSGAGSASNETGATTVRAVALIDGNNDMAAITFSIEDDNGDKLHVYNSSVSWDLSGGLNLALAFGEHNVNASLTEGLTGLVGHYEQAAIPAPA